MAADKAKSIALMMLRPKGGMAPGGDGDATDTGGEMPEDKADGGSDDALEGAMADLRDVMQGGDPSDMAAAFRAAVDAAQG